MNPLDHQRAMLDLAYQLNSNQPLSPEQISFLSIAFYRIGTGEDANKVLGLKLPPGQKLKDLISRRRLSYILHFIAGAMNPDPYSTEKAMNLEAACELANIEAVPRAKKIFPGADDNDYDAEYLLRCWHEPKYKHMRSYERHWFDSDFPYYFFPKDKDPSST
jgi:hypothetical protein